MVYARFVDTAPLDAPAAPDAAKNIQNESRLCDNSPNAVDASDDHLALPSSMATWLFRVSWLSASTCLLALYMHLFDLALVPAVVLFTSVNYWRRPDYSWRRYVDIITVQLAVYYQVARAVEAPTPYRHGFYCALSFACLAFIIAMIYYVRPSNGKWRAFLKNNPQKRQWLKISTFWHAQCHIFGNVANAVLYISGVPEMQNCWFVQRNDTS